jgi:hypothetical protein
MFKMLPLFLALVLTGDFNPQATTSQKWTAGWDIFDEPLNYRESGISWSVNDAARTLTVTFKLVGARPNKLYQVGIGPFCSKFPETFGQFPSNPLANGDCLTQTKQGVTASYARVQVGVILTDLHGDGSTSVVVGPIAPGTYHVEFAAENGAGCLENGGAGDGSDCLVVFQSPGPHFSDTARIVIP